MPPLKTSLYDTTIKMLQDRPRHTTYDDLAMLTGIKADWLQKLALGRHKKPCVNHVQTVYEVLSGRNLI